MGSANWSHEDHCGDGHSEWCASFELTGAYHCYITVGGDFLVYKPDSIAYANRITLPLGDFPSSTGIYEIMVDSSGTDSAFVYKYYFSKSRGIEKFITKSGEVFTLQ